jgi:putative endonuclease
MLTSFTVYCLYSKKFDRIYIGYTTELIQRFYSHNEFSKKGHTVKYRPWMVAYVEFCDSKADALKREKQLKSYQGRVFLKSYIQKHY